MGIATCVPPALLFVLLGAFSGPAPAQPGANPGVDVSLGVLSSFTYFGRTGTYPNGANGFSMLTTSCNLGTLNIPWLISNGAASPACATPMEPRHPSIAFLAVRESAGRLVQISDRSFVKHGFYALSDSNCTPCQQPSPGTFLGVGCSDTYATGNNSDRYFLAPPDEINPWTGIWSPCGSHFDRGEPPVSPPSAQTDGARSLSTNQVNAMNAVLHRVSVPDAELAVPGSTFWYQAMYVLAPWVQNSTTDPCPNPGGVVGQVLMEPDGNRTNNLASKSFTAVWTGTGWNIGNGTSFLAGSVLQRWNGGNVTSGANGNDDGRLYVAVKVTGPDLAGRTHYEYAVHNRDNARGVSAFRIPACGTALVLNAGFRDIDGAGANDWTYSRTSAHIVFTAPPGNPLLWNSIFNVWFDSDAAPEPGSMLLDEALPGPGLPQVAVATTVPVGLYNENLGPGCAAATPPALFGIGAPPRATLGNATFGLATSGNGSLAQVTLFASIADGAFPLAPGCTLYASNIGATMLVAFGPANLSGIKTFGLAVAPDPILEGAHVDFQAVAFQPGAGAYLGSFNLSNGLRVRIGNSIPTCP